jgi:hypothetical protein
MNPRCYFAALALIGLMATGTSAQADTTYRMQVIAKVGDQVGNSTITHFGAVGDLNNTGALMVSVEMPGGNRAALQYSSGRMVAVVVAGLAGPSGNWPEPVGIQNPIRMNQKGDAALNVALGNEYFHGAYFWDFAAQKLSTVAEMGMPAVPGFKFGRNIRALAPAINNRDEVAIGLYGETDAGSDGIGIILVGRDGAMQPVALPDQLVSDGARISPVGSLILNDSGLAVFLAQRDKDEARSASAYLWEKGTLTPLVLVGADAPGGARVARVSAVRVSNQGRKFLVAAHLDNDPDRAGLFFAADGRLRAVAVPGQEMPGGGKLDTIPERSTNTGHTLAHPNISGATETGEYAFQADLEDGSQAIYRLGADEKLSLVVRTGTKTDLGVIATLNPNPGVTLNDHGQGAVIIETDAGAELLAVLSPIQP